MKYLSLVRDGSEQTLVKGYWCIEVYADLRDKRMVPLALDVYSLEDPTDPSGLCEMAPPASAFSLEVPGYPPPTQNR